MGNALLESVVKFREIHGRPLKVGIYYTGGTFACYDTPDGLKPLDSPGDLEGLLDYGIGIRPLKTNHLLEIHLDFLFSKDSTNMTTADRDKMVSAITPSYPALDGFILIHGTDTGAETAKHLQLAMPYFNPYFDSQINWAKPVVLVSSQSPGAYRLGDEMYLPGIGSDAPINLATAVIAIADGIVGESGLLTNGYQLLRGSASTKITENEIPPYEHDRAVPPLGTLTAIGMRYDQTSFLRRMEQTYQFIPITVIDAGRFERQVITVTESSQLNLYNTLSHGVTLEQWMKESLPKILVYQSKGAGNVPDQDASVLDVLRDSGVLIFRTPLPGGRIPPKKLYDTRGDEYPGLNMQMHTARSKAMMALSLAEKVSEKERTEFVKKVMEKSWGNEFLPQR